MKLRVLPDPYSPGVLIAGAAPLAVLTRGEAEQLRDDLTAQLLEHSGETPAERAHRELHDGTNTYLPPERAA